MLTPEPLHVVTSLNPFGIITVRAVSGGLLTRVSLDTFADYDDPHEAAVRHAVRSAGPVEVEHSALAPRGHYFKVTPVTPPLTVEPPEMHPFLDSGPLRLHTHYETERGETPGYIFVRTETGRLLTQVEVDLFSDAEDAHEAAVRHVMSERYGMPDVVVERTEGAAEGWYTVTPRVPDPAITVYPVTEHLRILDGLDPWKPVSLRVLVQMPSSEVPLQSPALYPSEVRAWVTGVLHTAVALRGPGAVSVELVD